MRTYICKFRFGGLKFSNRVQAWSQKAAETLAKSTIESIGGEVISVQLCPLS